MSAPKRIQRLRTPGWKMPLDVVYVGRPTAWGNPFPVSEVFSRAEAVRMFRELVVDGETSIILGHGGEHHFRRADRGRLHVPDITTIRKELAGKDLCCWCPMDVECHADVLLELANSASRWIDKHGDVWELHNDGLLHTPETRPFPREHVEKKWGPLRALKELA